MANLDVVLRNELNAVEQSHAILEQEIKMLRKDSDIIVKALAECVDANDELHNALAGDPGSDPEAHSIFVAAQRRETAAVQVARRLVANWIGGFLE